VNKKYDVGIIGSGIGGLASAALLAGAGKKVILIEKEPKPGGYLAEFKKGNFTFDVSLHLINSCDKGQYTHNMLEKCHISDDIKFTRPKYLYRSIFPDFDLRIPQKNVNAYKELLVNIFPQSRAGILNFFDEVAEVYNEVNSYKVVGSLAPSLALYLKNNLDVVISKYIDDARLKGIICQLWLYFGLPLSKLRAMDFCYPWYDYLSNGGYYLEKGSYAIVKALVNYIKKKGGKFLFSTEADRILTKNNSCVGIGFGNKEVLCDTVISNIDIHKTAYQLIEGKGFSPASINRLKSIEPSISAFEIFLGLDADLRSLYPDDYEIFVNSGYDIDEDYRASLCNNAERAPFIITINSNANNFAAPKGKSVVTIIMLSGYDYWCSAPKGEYEDKKEHIAEVLIKRAGEVIPEISSSVRQKVIASPLTFERYTNNSQGSIYGYVRTLDGRIEIKPNNLKKIENLHFVGAWSKQGSGVANVLRTADEVYNKIVKQAVS